MDDETYIKMGFFTLPDPQFYTAEPDEALKYYLEKRFWYGKQFASVT